MWLQIEAVFSDFDKDGDGFITRTELKAAMLMLDKPMTDLEVDSPALIHCFLFVVFHLHAKRTEPQSLYRTRVEARMSVSGSIMLG